MINLENCSPRENILSSFVEQAMKIAQEEAVKKLSSGGQNKLVTRYIEDLKGLNTQQSV